MKSFRVPFLRKFLRNQSGQTAVVLMIIAICDDGPGGSFG